MSDFTPFWYGWIFILTVGNIIACVWLVWWTLRKRTNEATEGDVTGHTWDGDLQEYNNPLPRWWLWLYFATIIFGSIYLILYPGVWDGVLKWTSADKSARVTSFNSQYEKEMAKADETYGPIFAKFRAVAVPELAKNEEAKGMGKRLFLTYCMQCHGSDAKGGPGYPNLTDKDWRWGGSPDEIQASIANGRMGIMPPGGGKEFKDNEIDELANFVVSLSGRKADEAKAAKGKEHYATICIACHGPEGKGTPALGAPDLTASSGYIYGASLGKIKEGIAKGHNGVMPAHKGLLGDDKVHLLTAYVYGLSN